MSITNLETDFYVGFHRKASNGPHIWLWNNGKNVDQKQWKNGYPLNDDKSSCGSLSKEEGLLLDADCTNMNGFICESFQGNKGS